MKKLIFALIIILATASTALAKGWTPETLPMVHLQDSTRYVCNPDGVLSQATVDSLDFMLRGLKNARGVESVLIVVKHIEGNDPYNFCMKLGNSYGVGNKDKRTGLIILLSTEDRAYQIITGRGLEGTLPDAACYDIEQTHMVPYLKEGEWDEAMLRTTMAISVLVLDDPTLNPPDEEVNPWGLLGVMGLVGGGIYGLRRASQKKCPKCGKRKLKRTEFVHIKSDALYQHYRASYLCKACGHTFSEKTKLTHSQVSSAAAAGAAGSTFHHGSSFGRSSSSGGSFGGGSFGGGGAGGRF